MAVETRIPFEAAIAEPRLLKPTFDALSVPQQVALKCMYGVALDARKVDDRGWTEVDHWHAFQGFADYDELGYISRIRPGGPPPPTTEFKEAWGIGGVRMGKTASFAAPIICYEAVCGGHESRITSGRRAFCFLVAQDLRFARHSLPGIRAVLDSMAFINKGKIVRATADQIDLWNGVTIGVVPPTVKAVRGYDSPVAVMDEIGIWSQTVDQANPDFQVYNQIRSRQATFTHPKIAAISSPWIKSGMLFNAHEAGTNGSKLVCDTCKVAPVDDCKSCEAKRAPYQGKLILHATTASFGNPLVTKEWLKDSYRADPKAFERECLARFVDALSGFLDVTLLASAVDSGVTERVPSPRAFYVAAIDPAFRRDAFGLCIGHNDADKGFVVDVLRRWPEQGSGVPGQPLNPADVLAEIAQLCRTFRIVELVSDQYQVDSLQVLAMQFGLSVRQVTFTGASKAEIYGNLHQLVNTKKLRLLDHPETLRELRSIERRNMSGGTVKIGSPKGQHDDMATVVALAAHQAAWLTPMAERAAPTEPTKHERIEKQIARNRYTVATADDYDYA